MFVPPEVKPIGILVYITDGSELVNSIKPLLPWVKVVVCFFFKPFQEISCEVEYPGNALSFGSESHAPSHTGKPGEVETWEEVS